MFIKERGMSKKVKRHVVYYKFMKAIKMCYFLIKQAHILNKIIYLL